MPHSDSSELDPISFWMLLLLSGGQHFTFHDLVKTMDRSKENVWDSLQILESKKYVKVSNSKYVIDFAGIEYLTKLGIPANKAEELPNLNRLSGNAISPNFFSNWSEMVVWSALPLTLLIIATTISFFINILIDNNLQNKLIYQFFAWSTFLFLFIFYLKRSYHYIKENERFIVFQSGKIISKRGPGHILLTPYIQHYIKVDLREHVIEIKNEPCITRDKILVTISFYVSWQIDDPIRSLTKVTNLENSLSLLATAIIKSTIAEYNMEDAMEKQRALNVLICSRIELKSADWGVQINNSELSDLLPPKKIQKQIENRFNAILESEAMQSKSIAKLSSLRDYLTIGEALARNPAAEKLAYADILGKTEDRISRQELEGLNSSLRVAKQLLSENPNFDLLHLEVMAPSFISVNDFLERKNYVLRSVDRMYSIFALLYTEKSEASSTFFEYLRNDDNRMELSNLYNQSINTFLYSNQIDTLMVVSSNYGSPLIEDLLGIGSVIGHIKEIIKDVSYRSKFEKEQSRIILEKLGIEKIQAEATLTKLNIENKQALIEIEKMELDNRQKKIEIIEKQLSLYEKVKNQKIPLKERGLIASALLTPIIKIAETEINPIPLNVESNSNRLPLETSNEEEEIDQKKQLLNKNKE